MRGRQWQWHKQQLRNAWTGKGTFTTVLLTAFVDAYGTEGVAWAPDTIRMEVEDDFNLKLPKPNFDRLMAGISLLLTNDFYRSLPDFIAMCNVLSGDVYDPRSWDPADALEVAWGITEAALIEPPEEDEPFTAEILGYIGSVLDDEGIMEAPDILKLAMRSKTPLTNIQGDFTDDPTMFAAIYEFEKGKTDEIDRSVKQNLQTLAAQLDTLPLRDGDAKGAVQKMLRALA